MREPLTIRLAVGAVGLIGLLCIMAITFLAWNERPVPDALTAAAGASLGSLATLLTTYSPSPVPGGRRATDPPA